MPDKLQEMFPMVRTRGEVLTEIQSRPDLKNTFDNWEKQHQEEFLDFVTGTRGVKMMYDGFCKEILNPEIVPERLEELLSLLLGENIHILQVLPNDNTRIADESALLITDILVKLENGSIVNVEIQRLGYYFPGERGACYSADLLLRQYKMIRKNSGGKRFSYRNVKDVYTIVFLAKSTEEFHEFPDSYLHYFEQTSNTGLKLNLLQKYLFISLDMFLKIVHNTNQQEKSTPAGNRLDAWLLFLCGDDPEDILAIVEKYPDFKAMYEQIYRICQNMENVMGIFSEELRIMDRNTVQFMVDDMSQKIEVQARQLEEQEQQITEQRQQLAEQREQHEQQLAEQREQFEKQKQQLEQKNLEMQAQIEKMMKQMAGQRSVQ